MGEGKTRGSQAPADAPVQGKGPRSIVRPPDAETPKRSVAKHYYTPLAAAAEGLGTTRGWSWPWR